jgi:hypothetical protein
LSFKSVNFELGIVLAEHRKHRSVFGEHLPRFENVPPVSGKVP